MKAYILPKGFNGHLDTDVWGYTTLKSYDTYDYPTYEVKSVYSFPKTKRVDNREFAYILVDSYVMLHCVDTVTNKAYRVKNGRMTWRPIKKYIFVNWA